jgi:hypothetical protein
MNEGRIPKEDMNMEVKGKCPRGRQIKRETDQDGKNRLGKMSHRGQEDHGKT